MWITVASESSEEEDEDETLDDGHDHDSDEEGGGEAGAVVTLADMKPAIQAWAVRAGLGLRLGAIL
jgi:hypothetical protein